MQTSKMCVDIIAIENILEAISLRSVLEYWGAHVNLHYIATHKDLVHILNRKGQNVPSTIILSCHGDETGICMPKLAPQVAAEQSYNGNLNSKQLSEFLFLPNHMVINTGCSLGHVDFANAFLDSGCKAYIGAIGDPEGNSAMFYVLNFFYELLCNNREYKDAHLIASEYDSETKLFKLYGT